MAELYFPARLRGSAPPDGTRVPGFTVRAALEAAFAVAPLLRAYVLDERGALRPQLALFRDGARLEGAAALAAPVTALSLVELRDAR